MSCRSCMFANSKILYAMFRVIPEHGVTSPVTCFFLSVFLVILTAIPGLAQNFDAFLEPNQVVDISSPFRDRIGTIHVLDGDRVTAGQLLAELDTQVLKAKLASAQEAAFFHGRIDSAGALVTMEKNRYAMLRELEKSGNARPQEMTKAKTDLVMAQAQLQSARDDRRLKELESDIIRAQIEEKKLYSPVDGVVVKIYKQQAELIGGTDQQGFITIVQLDPLQALFHLPPDVARKLKTASRIAVDVDGKSVTGEVDFISPIINAQSGTVEVRIRIANFDNQLTSGSRCTLDANLLSGDMSHDRRKNQPTADKSPLQ